MIIIGAGLAGLIAAHAWPKASVLEAAPGPLEQHKALLRFRSTAVADITGCEFKPVTVRKAIYSNQQFVAPNPQLSNWYAQKCVGRTIDRSIWNLETTTRFIAPEDLYMRLVEAVGDRLNFGVEADFEGWNQNVVNTAPLPVVLKSLNIAHEQEFNRAPITVQRHRVFEADVYQTIYFPDPSTALYRASMTGDVLICEYVGQPDVVDQLLPFIAFGLDDRDHEELSRVEQRYGKIAPVDDHERKALLARLTTDHQIFSLGRFATWRNILLDDVVHDIAVIKRLMTATSYDAKLIRG